MTRLAVCDTEGVKLNFDILSHTVTNRILLLQKKTEFFSAKHGATQQAVAGSGIQDLHGEQHGVVVSSS